MQEVTIRIRFNRECLGHTKKRTRKREVIFRMPRDGNGKVMFLPGWWRGNLRWAAKVLNRYGNEAREVRWDPIIDGRLSDWKRTVVPASEDRNSRTRYALHEAFRPGDVIGVNALLPERLNLDAFSELLQLVGTYKGISPFQSDDENYGTFEVISVLPAIRSRKPASKPTQEALADE